MEPEKKRYREPPEGYRPPPIYQDEESTQFRFHQFLGIILVLSFLIIGSTAGSFGLFRNMMEAPCLGCLGLVPNVELEFQFDTVGGRAHPDFVLDELNSAAVFIEFTQNDEFCPPCKRMRPEVKKLEKEYGDKVIFFIININENQVTRFHQNETSVEPIVNADEDTIYATYDIENWGGGRPATPTYIIITLKLYINVSEK